VRLTRRTTGVPKRSGFGYATFVGLALPDGKVILLRRIVGGQPFAVFQKALDDLGVAKEHSRR